MLEYQLFSLHRMKCMRSFQMIHSYHFRKQEKLAVWIPYRERRQASQPLEVTLAPDTEGVFPS